MWRYNSESIFDDDLDNEANEFEIVWLIRTLEEHNYGKIEEVKENINNILNISKVGTKQFIILANLKEDNIRFSFANDFDEIHNNDDNIVYIINSYVIKEKKEIKLI